MRVGILTFHRAHNYGAMLQAYGLKKTCEKLGADTSVIDYAPEYIDKQYRYFKFTGNIRRILLNIYNLRGNCAKKKFFEAFKNNFMNLRPFETNEKFDIILYGSDQIWNPNIKNGFDKVYFGYHNIPVVQNVAYAASIGKSQFSKDELKQFSKIAQKLDRISVREETARDILQSVVKKKIEVVLDPTLLLSAEEWTDIAMEPNISGAYILVYEVNIIPQTMEIAISLSKKLDIPIVEITYNKTKLHYKHRVLNNVGPREFIGLFKNASYIITSSFHGTAFSIIFRKNFYTVVHRAYGSRMQDLLNKIGLADRMVEKLPERVCEIDYLHPAEMLNKEREKSLNFLIENMRERMEV